MTIHIIQPALPKYRADFFSLLNTELLKINENLIVYATKFDHLGVSSITTNEEFKYNLNSKIIKIFGGKLLWQSNLQITLKPCDILILDGNPRWLNNYIIFVYAKIKKVPVIWWGQGLAVGSNGFLSKVRKKIMCIYDYIILYTDKEVNEYISSGFKSNVLFGLNNGLDFDQITKVCKSWTQDNIGEFKKNNRLTSCNYWCIFIGRITKKSNISQLINSFNFLDKEIGLIIVGDGPYKDEATNLINQLDLSSRVILTGPLFDEDDIAPWMLSSSLFVYPGSVGLSLIHGFSYGLPAVIHNDRFFQNPEYAAFIDSQNGKAFVKDSICSIAESINYLIYNPILRKKMTTSILSMMAETFNTRNMTKRFINVINTIRTNQYSD